MKQSNTSVNRVVGIDLSDKYSSFVVLSGRGEVIGEGKVRTTDLALRKQFTAAPAMRIALEVGCHSPWVSRLLSELGHEVIVANPRQLQLISKSVRKSDRVDALTLARVARLDPQLLRPVHHRGSQAQADLAMMRSRAELVAMRTSLINHARGSVKAMGGRLPACPATSFHKRATAAIPDSLKPALEPILAVLADLTVRIRAMDKELLRIMAERYPGARFLMSQIHGVGPLTALAFVITLERPERFRRSRDVGAYLGLTRKRRDSGESTPALHITKAGDPFLRRLLVQCAHYILGPFAQASDLRAWGLLLAGRLGHKRAIIAVARKLAVLMHRLLITGEVYEPLRRAQATAA